MEMLGWSPTIEAKVKANDIELGNPHVVLTFLHVPCTPPPFVISIINPFFSRLSQSDPFFHRIRSIASSRVLDYILYILLTCIKYIVIRMLAN